MFDHFSDLVLQRIEEEQRASSTLTKQDEDVVRGDAHRGASVTAGLSWGDVSLLTQQVTDASMQSMRLNGEEVAL